MVGFSKYNVAVPSMANKLKDTNGNSTFGVVTSAIIDANIPMIAKMLMIKIVFFMAIGLVGYGTNIGIINETTKYLVVYF